MDKSDGKQWDFVPIDRKYQRDSFDCGYPVLGGELLVDALFRAVKAAQEIGIFAVRVDAIDLKAKEFYLKYEFIPFEDSPLSLFLPIETITREFM